MGTFSGAFDNCMVGIGHIYIPAYTPKYPRILPTTRVYTPKYTTGSNVDASCISAPAAKPRVSQYDAVDDKLEQLDERDESETAPEPDDTANVRHIVHNRLLVGKNKQREFLMRRIIVELNFLILWRLFGKLIQKVARRDPDIPLRVERLL